MNYRVFLRFSVGQKLAGLQLGTQKDMTLVGFLRGQDCSRSVVRSLKTPTKTFLPMCATKLFSLSRKKSRPLILPSH